MAQTRLNVLDLPHSVAIPRRDLDALAARERVADRYWSCQDPINELRTWWRAQTVRHMFHLLPGESILELGCGSGHLTRALLEALGESVRSRQLLFVLCRAITQTGFPTLK